MKPRQSDRASADKKGTAKLSEVIPELIRLYEDRSDYRDTELPKLYKDYPLVSPEEDPESPPAPQDALMRELLMKLPADKIYQLILIEYLGLGYFGARDMDEHFEEIKDDFGKPESAVSYLLNTAMLEHHLMKGLARLNESEIDVDKLDDRLRKPTQARK
jgi:hypothetical protein